MIVVDANVIAYFFLAGEQTSGAESLYETDPDWCAPRLWRSEFRNILAGYLRRRVLSIGEAIAVQREAEELLASGEYDVGSEALLALVAASDCSAYDCEFVALAQQLNVHLVTMDKKLLKAFPALAVPLPGA